MKRMMKISDEYIAELAKEVMHIVESIENEKTREILLDFLANGAGQKYFTMPASAKVDYHNCFPGGLVEHSLRVYHTFKAFCNIYLPDANQDSIIICALFHDLGKIGSLTQDYFIPETSDWHMNTLGRYYNYNPELSYLDADLRTLSLLGQIGVKLTDEEFKAILIHDGQYKESNKQYAQQEGMFALLLHQADRLSVEVEKNKYKDWLNDNA